MNSNSSQAIQSPVVAGIVLAAGKGTRMRSPLPKVLHPVLGRPMVGWILRSLEQAGVKKSVLVIGADHGPFTSFLDAHPDLALAVQVNQRGTADAVASTYGAFKGVSPISYAEGYILRGDLVDATHVLICAGDTPAIQGAELSRFITEHAQSDVAVLGMKPDHPYGYGRLVLRDGVLTGIVEEKDADPETKKIRLVNSGVILARIEVLFKLLARIAPNNAQGEYYLTDVVRLAYQEGLITTAHIAENADEFSGVNDRKQLSLVETWMLRRVQTDIMAQGVTIHLPDTVYIEAGVAFEGDCEVYPGARLYGGTRIGKGCRIGAGTSLRNAVIRDGAQIGDGAIIVGVEVERDTVVPPLVLLQH